MSGLAARMRKARSLRGFVRRTLRALFISSCPR